MVFVLVASLLLKVQASDVGGDGVYPVGWQRAGRCPQDGAGTCCDLEPEDVHHKNPKVATCARNTIWAKQTGIKTLKGWYTQFTNLSPSSTFHEFQCMLAKKNSDKALMSNGHGCFPPCTQATVAFKNGAQAGEL